MRQLIYLKRLYVEKVITLEEYKSAVISYLNDMPDGNLAENIVVIIVSNYIIEELMKNQLS